MQSPDRISRLLRSLPAGALFLVLFLLMSACSLLRPDAPEQRVIREPDLPPAVVTQAPAEAVHPPIVIVPPEPEPEPVAPTVFSHRVAIVLSGRQPSYESVAKELELVLEDYSLYDLSDRSQTVRNVFSSIADEQATAIVAIGLRAALSARALSGVPVVFCQVFNVNDNDLITDTVKGVSSIPPLSMQLKAWKELDPQLANVGAIVGSGHDELIEEAELAAAELGIRMHVRVAGSDKETLYLFNRLVPDIDGFLLFPDNRILSRTVLDEILGYASRHRVQVAVFNESLLAMGATLSASTVDADIASAIVRVLDQFENDKGYLLPALTPLTAIQIRTNKTIVQQYGLDDAGAESVAGAL
ncbi:MAG TPA: ABC transporter substrate binding protein [Woeseiaceae bacterium]|nr:ABC transporter substrate binding protein [Woeseiaceae bacterium]